MPKKFVDAVSGLAPAGPYLPLVHTTSAPTFEFYIEPSGQLEARACPVYRKEELVYLFYGKPSYRPKGAEKNHRHMLQFAPVCLVLDVPPSLSPKRVMPFDSGAYHDKLIAKEGHAHTSLPKELFELPTLDAARAVVGLFFGSNLKYFDEIPLEPTPIDSSLNTCVETYVSLIDRKGSNRGDSRLTSIEVQFNQDIALAGSVLAVAMAEPFYQKRPEVQATLKAWRAEPLLYAVDGTYTPGYCCKVIENMIRAFLIREGRMK
jgi:hypothetical protein